MDRDFHLRPAPLTPWCPRVATRLKLSCQATVMRTPRPSTARDHLGIRCYFASLFHVPRLCAPSVCRFEWRLNDGFPLRTWHTTVMPGRPAGWELTAAARHSFQPHQSLRRQTWRPWAPWKTCSLTSLLSVTRQKETDWLTDWMTGWGGKYTERQDGLDLMDRCVGEHSIRYTFFFTVFMCCKRKLFHRMFLLLQKYNRRAVWNSQKTSLFKRMLFVWLLLGFLRYWSLKQRFWIGSHCGLYYFIILTHTALYSDKEEENLNYHNNIYTIYAAVCFELHVQQTYWPYKRIDPINATFKHDLHTVLTCTGSRRLA